MEGSSFNSKNPNLKGGALVFALLILLIGSILIGLFITMDSGYKQLNDKFNTFQKAENKVLEGFKLGYYLNSPSYLGKKEEKTEGLEVTKKLWGSYYLISSKVKLDSSNSLSKIGLIGNEIGKKYSFYLANTNGKLSITGNTIIKGDVFIPEKGVSISYVEGKSYTRTKLVEGEVNTSKSSLPEINKFIVQEYSKYLEGTFNQRQDSILLIENLVSTEIENSFFDKTIILYSNSGIFLNEAWNLKGNVLLFSKGTVTIDKSARLSEVIICAQNILIEEGFSSSLQLVASNLITLDSNVVLKYPSSILTLGDSSTITLLGSASLSGSIFSIGKSSKSINQVVLSKNSLVSGLVYCDSKVEPKGKIDGKLITKKLVYKSPSTEYTNTLIDATITNELPNYYCVSPLLKTNNPSIHLIKWLK